MKATASNDQTLLASGPNAGKTASNGFDALSALDSNADLVMDAADAAYANLKIWRDLNRDGISQAGKLQSLSEAGITAINLDANAQGVSSFIKTATDADGNAISTNQTIKNVNLGSDPFYRELSDNPVVTASAAALPQMQGAGLVRDLREALSLGTAQSGALLQQVSAFQDATSTEGPRLGFDALTTTLAVKAQRDRKRTCFRDKSVTSH